jgi:hypothetical protein
VACVTGDACVEGCDLRSSEAPIKLEGPLGRRDRVSSTRMRCRQSCVNTSQSPGQPLDPDKLYPPRSAGAFLGRGETFTRKLIKDGHLEAVREGGAIRVPGWAIRKYRDSLPPVQPAPTAHPCVASTKRGEERPGGRNVIVTDQCQCPDFAPRGSKVALCSRTGCGHPANFHGGADRCTAMGCSCARWLPPNGPDACDRCGHDATRHGLSTRRPSPRSPGSA